MGSPNVADSLEAEQKLTTGKKGSMVLVRQKETIQDAIGFLLTNDEGSKEDYDRMFETAFGLSLKRARDYYSRMLFYSLPSHRKKVVEEMIKEGV